MTNTGHLFKKRGLGTILMFMFLICGNLLCAQQNAESEVRKLFARAKTAFEMQEYADALEEYKKAQKLIPNYPAVYKAMAEVHEKLGTENDLQSAIANYNKYLELSPKAQDKDSIIEKIASLEYRKEKQTQQAQILDNISGLWISNLVLKKDERRPYIVLKIEEVQKSGKFRVTLLPESGMFKETIIEKTVNIAPGKDNSFRFVLADALEYNPSSSSYDFLRIGVSALGGSDLKQALGQTAVNAMQEADVPSNTKTAYHFELKYENGQLKGLLNIVQKHAVSQTNRTTQDEMLEIFFTKQNISYRGNFIDYVPDEEKPEILKYHAEAHQLYLKGLNQNKQSSNLITGGLIVAGVGLLGALILVPKDTESEAGAMAWACIGLAGLGTGMLAAALPLTITGQLNQKKAIKLYKEDMTDNRRRNDMKFSLGITPSGGVGLTLNY